jgi:hypothetical protein
VPPDLNRLKSGKRWIGQGYDMARAMLTDFYYPFQFLQGLDVLMYLKPQPFELTFSIVNMGCKS